MPNEQETLRMVTRTLEMHARRLRALEAEQDREAITPIQVTGLRSIPPLVRRSRGPLILVVLAQLVAELIRALH